MVRRPDPAGAPAIASPSDDACPEISALDAFACGRVGPTELAAMERHLASCTACASAIADAVRDAAPDDDRGAPERIGRYVLLERLGRGATAEVHAAYDPRLRRRVALKVLATGAPLDGIGRERTLREAQALARVEHPNVLTVYDVSPVDHDPMYIAMELIEGESLRGWSARADRPWREVLRVLVDAAHGLAALHAAGIIHRDVKPDNILVGEDSRVCIADLGLAMAQDGGMVTQERSGDPDAESLDVTLTRTGTVLGTPRYMSPEHFAGTELDARSDQFGFCVAAAEALFGVRVFAGSSFAELRDAVARGPSPTPPSTRAPAALWRVLRRGLAADPSARFASMSAVIAALAGVAHRRRRLVATAAGLVGIAAFGVAAAGPPARCTERLVFAEHWTAGRALVVEQAFAATVPRHGPDAAATVTGELEQWSERWNGAWLARCTASVHGQVDVADDPQLRCLDRQRVEFLASLGALDPALGESTASDRIVTMVRGLPSPRGCDDPRGDAAVAGSDVERDVEQGLAAVLAASRLAHHVEAKRGLGDLRRRVDEVRPGLQAQIHLAAAAVLSDHDAEASAAAAEDALLAAIRADDPSLMGRALVARAQALIELGRLDAGIAAAELGVLTLGELDRGSPHLVAARLAEALALQRQGQIDPAIAVLEPLAPALEPGTVPWALYQQGLAELLGQRGDDARALESFEAARAVFVEHYGPHTDNTVRVGIAIVEFAREHQRLELAARSMPQACVDASMRATLDTATIADCLVAQGLLDLHGGALELAHERLTQAAEGREQVFGPDAPPTLAVLDILATVQSQQGDLAAAEATFRRLVDAHTRTGNLAGVALVSGNLAVALEMGGRSREAVAAYERSLAAANTTRLRARALSGLAALQLDLGERVASLATLERALLECERGGVPTLVEMDIRWALARQLPDEPSAVARAQQLAGQARALAELAGDGATRDAIAAWSAEHAAR